MIVRRLVVACAATVAVALLVSAGSFSAVDAERGVSVAVADDQSAFVGIETNNQSVVTRETPTRVALLTVTNNFAVGAQVTDTSLDGGGPPAPKVEDHRVTDRVLGPGEETDITARVTCATGTEVVSVSVTVETDAGTYVELARPLRIDCVTPSGGPEDDTDGESGEEDGGSDGKDDGQ